MVYGRGVPVRCVGGLLTADPVEGTPPAVVPEISLRYKAPGLLFVGSVAALCAFLGTFLVTFIQFFRVNGSEILGIQYESGNGYWPETVSESVHNRNSPAGKIFFTGCLIAAIMFFLSWYPYSLRNVYTGPETTCCGQMYSTTCRQYVPYIGLLMLIGISTYPQSVAHETAGAQVCVVLHLAGAGMMFVGYMLAEFKCLEFCGMKHQDIDADGNPKEYKYLSIEGTEYKVRSCLASGIGACFTIFLVFQGLLMLPTGTAPCCYDTWILGGSWYNLTDPQDGTITHNLLQISHVNNTASGGMLGFKLGSYFAEVLAGLFLIGSHFAIWFFCEERMVDFGESHLEMVYDDRDDDM